MEEWRPVKGYEGLYEVSNEGRVRSLDRVVIAKDGRKMHVKGRVLSTSGMSGRDRNYPLVTLWSNNRGYSIQVHRLVAFAFLGDPQNGMMVDHIDGDTTNNNVSNLEWVTCGENNSRAYALGLKKSTQRKLRQDQVREIRSSSLSGKDLSKMYGISQSNISNIRNRKTYREVF